MQLPIDSSWIVNFQRAAGTSLRQGEETVDKEEDEVINDFSGSSPLGKTANSPLASGNSVSWTVGTKSLWW